MRTAERNISELDYVRLMGQIQDDLEQQDVPPCCLHRLYMLLRSARRYKPEEIPQNVVTMNSDIMVRYIRSGAKKVIRIVYPAEHFLTETIQDKDADVVVYEPQALEVLGRKVNDIYFDQQGNRTEAVVIEKVLFQPEARRLFNL